MVSLLIRSVLVLASTTCWAVAGTAVAGTEVAATGRTGALLPDAVITAAVQGGVTVLRVEGIITAGFEQRFAGALAALPPRAPIAVELDSPGGFTAPGYRIVDRMLAEREAGRPIATRVRGGDSCESMCVAIFLAGYPRYAEPSAEFMVHAPRLLESGHLTLRSTQAMVERLQALGAAKHWLERVRAAGGFSGRVDHRETAVQLAAENANIVTDLIR